MNSLSVPPPLPGHFALPPISQKPQSTIPPRFYLTFAALFALFVATFLSTISPLNAILWNQPIINPLLTLLTIGLCGSLLLTAIGSPDLKTSTLVSLLTTVFELGVIVDVLEVAAQIADNGMKISLLEPIASALREMRSPEPSWHAFKVCLIFNVCLVAAEEASKLGVVLIFIRLRIIKNPRTALACGALAGLTFGLIESNVYGFTNFAASGSSLPEYLNRYLVMSSVHALWDVFGVGFAYFLASPRKSLSPDTAPGILPCLLAFLTTILIHDAHNTLQYLIGPYTQFITVLALLFPTYVFTKRVWRSCPLLPEQSSPASSLTILTILLVGSSFAMIYIPHQTPMIADKLEEYHENIETLERLINSPDPLDPASSNFKSLKYQIDQFRPSEPETHQAMTEIFANLSRRSPLSTASSATQAPFWITGPNTSESINETIQARRCDQLLDQCRFLANRVARQNDFDPSYHTIYRCQLTVRHIDLSPQLTSQIRARRLALILITSDNAETSYISAARSESFPFSKSISLPNPWTTDLSFPTANILLCLTALKPSGDLQPIDLIHLPTTNFQGDLTTNLGSHISIDLQRDKQ